MLGRLGLVAVALSGLVFACADSTQRGDSSTADLTACAALCNALCQVSQLSCSSSDGATTGEATITSRDGNGCTGTMTFPTEAVSLWIHCDECRFCAEHVTECFATTFAPTSFSYLVATKARTITCTKK